MSEKTTERTRSVDIDYEGETRNVSVQDVPLGSNVEKSSETIAEEPRRERKPDTGFAWVILFMGMLNFIIAFGNFVAFGVFQTYYLKVMFVDQKAASIAWVGTLTNAMAQSCGVLTGPLAFYIGVRGVMIFAGVTGVTALGFLYGLSSGIVANMTFTVVSGWFEVKRTPALTLLSIGGVLGGLVLVPTNSGDFVLCDFCGWLSANETACRLQVFKKCAEPEATEGSIPTFGLRCTVLLQRRILGTSSVLPSKYNRSWYVQQFGLQSDHCLLWCSTGFTICADVYWRHPRTIKHHYCQ
ncbi:Monocarboxylate transporter 9 [Zancudomyces culisetae]|uniref:Monocarboxylate transporter 9 n=1 Tax=Zancudomyces culisetae TaxID=1213189 RepID=A0A1R1PT65_ZANCU|nr:Monocarboxylate transporter 9 [Zancudomyces culisetae]|eukprot:OMH84082.1 Monocarboxylate transporter 9 [Zancudomyces culisetae]